jgi:hypothetical protein
LFMHGIAAHNLTDRFAWLFEGLCKAIGVGAHKRGMEAVLAWVVWNRVRLLGERLIALAGRVQAGRLRRRTRRQGARHPNPAGQARGQACPQGGREREAGRQEAVRLPMALPGAFGWIRKVLPETAQFAGVIQYMLRDPDVAGLVEKAPQAGRILRRLCHLLGVNAPEFLRRGSGGAENIPGVARAVNDAISAIAPTGGAVPPLPAASDAAGPAATLAMPGAGDEGDAAEGERQSPPAPSSDANVAAPPPADWLRQDAEAMRERVARWVARHADAPSTLLPLGLAAAVEFPGTRPFRRFSKIRD